MAKKVFRLCGEGLQSFDEIIVDRGHHTKANQEGSVGSLRSKVDISEFHGKNSLQFKATAYDQIMAVCGPRLKRAIQEIGSALPKTTLRQFREYMSAEEVQPGVTFIKRIAKKPKRCSACHCLIMPGESYWDRKVNWQRYSQPICERCKEALGSTVKVGKPEEVVERLRKTWPLTIEDTGLEQLRRLDKDEAVAGLEKPDSKASQSLPRTQELIDKFLKAKKGKLRPDSITSYGATLRSFARSYPELPLEPEPIEAYLDNFSHANTTALYKFSVLRTFYFWLSRRNLIAVNPIKMVERPAGQADEVLPLNEEQVRLLHDEPKTDREQGYVGLMLDHGFRLSEVIRLDVGDIHEDRIWIHGKERKEFFPLLSEVRDWLLKLANGRGPGEPLFVSRQGRLSASQIQSDIKRLLQRAGINDVRQSPHTLRHTFSTLAYLAGCDWDAVELLLRQKEKKRNVVNRYIHLSSEQRLKLIREKLERYSPLRIVAEPSWALSQILPSSADDTLCLEGLAEAKIAKHLLPQFLDQCIALAETARVLKYQLDGNGHRPERGYSERQASK